MTESEIRDKLSTQLEIFQQNYTLVEKEKFFPNFQGIGTRSFIDLFARNESGKYVVIELKKADSSARQAIHEILKYLEALHIHYSCNTDEVELVIVSTEWDELLVPFSSLKKHYPAMIKGFKLDISEPTFKATEIKPIEIKNERSFSNNHLIAYYSSHDKLINGIKEFEKFYKKKQINNFVLVEFESKSDYSCVIEAQTKEMLKNNIPNISEEDLKKIPHFDYLKYMIYAVNELLTLNDYVSLIANPDEIQYLKEDYEGDDLLERLDECLIAGQREFPPAERFEVGNPKKYNNFINDTINWELVKIHRYGSLRQNKLLSDEVINNDIRGYNGGTREFYLSSGLLSNPAYFEKIKEQISKCLVHNKIWSHHINDILEKSKNGGYNNVFIYIYNPMNILVSICQSVINDSPMLPEYYIICENEDNDTIVYRGNLDGHIKNITMASIIRKFYKDSEIPLLLSLTYGGYTEENSSIIKYIGLKYRTYYYDSEGNYYLYTKEYDWKKIKPIDSIQEEKKILTEKNTLVPDVVNFFISHYLGAGVFSF